MINKNFGFGTQIRKSPYFDSTVKWGATGFSVYNHMYIPRDFGNPEQNFWNLIEKSILCDVAVERQVEITGPDAYKFIQLLTPRDLSKLSIGQCKYVLIVNDKGGIINDPVLLRLGENHFWLSLADSDVLLWAQGVAVNSGLNIKIGEPDDFSNFMNAVIDESSFDNIVSYIDFAKKSDDAKIITGAVSYTHLTLPTSDLV